MKTDKINITQKQIEAMLYLITAHAGKKEAKRFHKLSFRRQQIVTIILMRREKICQRNEMHIDCTMVSEVITDASNDKYIALMETR